MKKLVMAMIAGAVLVSGCSVRVADMTIASTKNYNLNSSKFVKGKRVIGEDNYPVIIFPLGFPNIKSAMDDAIQKDNCAVALSDVVMTSVNHSFLFGMIGYRVEGNLIIDQSQPGCASRT